MCDLSPGRVQLRQDLAELEKMHCMLAERETAAEQEVREARALQRNAEFRAARALAEIEVLRRELSGAKREEEEEETLAAVASSLEGSSPSHVQAASKDQICAAMVELEQLEARLLERSQHAGDLETEAARLRAAAVEQETAQQRAVRKFEEKFMQLVDQHAHLEQSITNFEKQDSLKAASMPDLDVLKPAKSCPEIHSFEFALQCVEDWEGQFYKLLAEKSGSAGITGDEFDPQLLSMLDAHGKQLDVWCGTPSKEQFPLSVAYARNNVNKY